MAVYSFYHNACILRTQNSQQRTKNAIRHYRLPKICSRSKQNRPTDLNRPNFKNILLTNFTRVLQPITQGKTDQSDLTDRSPTDNDFSLDPGGWLPLRLSNVRHNQQFFSELLSPERSHYTIS